MVTTYKKTQLCLLGKVGNKSTRTAMHSHWLGAPTTGAIKTQILQTPASWPPAVCG